MSAYGSLGYSVVWILHERSFNKWRVTAAEQLLSNHPFYYTDIDADGRGTIYDQLDLIEKGVRKAVIAMKAVDLSQPYIHPKLHFAGDFFELSLQEPDHPHFQQQRTSLKRTLKELFHLCIARPYKLLFQIVLEKSCK